jgi:hypothetical protein
MFCRPLRRFISTFTASASIAKLLCLLVEDGARRFSFARRTIASSKTTIYEACLFKRRRNKKYSCIKSFLHKKI